MKSLGESREFPAKIKLSFYKVFEELENTLNDPDKRRAEYASKLLEELKPYPELREGFDDPLLLEKYKVQIAKLLSHLFPSTLTTNEIKGAVVPFHFMPFFTSQRFGKIIEAAGDDFEIALRGMDDDSLYIIGCTMILQWHYGYKVNLNPPFILEIPNNATGVTRYYRSAYNADLTEVIPTEQSIPITEDDYNLLMDNFKDIDLWKKMFPPGSYIMRGIGIINLQDITVDQIIGKLTSDLLERSEGAFEKVVESFRALFNIKDLEVSYMSIEGGSFMKPPDGSMKGLLLNKASSIQCNEAMCGFGLDELINKQIPFVVSDVPKYHKVADNYLSNTLSEIDINSYLITPLIHNNECVGYLELGSNNVRDLSTVSIELLNAVLPILAVAAHRYKDEKRNLVEAVIQEKFTSIQSSLKWRFEDEANSIISSRMNGEKLLLKDIVFNDVYALYGQLDIKSSSTIRNEAIKQDLISQLTSAKNILELAMQFEKLPIYEELIFRTEGFITEIRDGLLAVSEFNILNFLSAELYPVFDHLKTKGEALKQAIEHYRSGLNSGMNIVYNEHRKFDVSVTKLNAAIVNLIDEKQVEAQKMFPHFYERFKTDGIEFNMYIGQSLTRNEKFNKVFHRNLQLWQLITICQAENVASSIKSELEMPLEVASLILVHSTPLSIHFRIDEKRFDVEGAYNARYEIIKKRIDKAHIKNTNERITVPGKIAIIYSHDQDAEEYRKYIKYLQSYGYLEKGEVEDHELENLQGITGLRSLRVNVNYAFDNNDNLSVDELIASMGNEK